jgi:small subunit ribosomal protein S20
MPHTKSAKKRVRTSEISRVKNAATTSLIKTRQRQFFEILARKDRAGAAKAFSVYCSTLDKAAKHGVIKQNNAMRKKARGAARLRALAA